jgi:hypothetical protein
MRTIKSKSSPPPCTPDHLDGLLSALGRVDRRLQGAVNLARRAYGPEAVADPFKGLHVSPAEVDKLLERPPGSPLFWQASMEEQDASAVPRALRFDWLVRTFGLLPFDVDVLLLSLATEIDSRYERIFGFVQNDVTRRRPTVDLALHLLCTSVADRLQQRRRFAPDAPLLRGSLIELVSDPQHASPTLLAHYLRVDGQIVRFLLGQDDVDARLADCCERRAPAGSIESLPLDDALKRRLHRTAAGVRKDGVQAMLYLRGPEGADKRAIAEALAMEARAPLLLADLTQTPLSDPEFDQTLRLLLREAWLHGSVLCLDNLDGLQAQGRAGQRERLIKALSNQPGLTLVCGSQPWPLAEGPTVPVTVVSLSPPNAPERQTIWRTQLASAGVVAEDRDIDTLSGRFRLTTKQITQAVLGARQQARWRCVDLPRSKERRAAQPTRAELFAAARSQCGHELATLTRKVEPSHDWSHIVLPEDTLGQLHELCRRAEHREQVMRDWGFDRKLSLGKGVSALFAGPSGTGKTMAAEIIASELGLDLYRIDLALVVSKYIGETEKNLDRIFAAAEDANCVLFFDEADALFGKRSEVRDSHDRYANLEISYLLQRMEQYEGLAILASNLQTNLDEAFVRRLAFAVQFPFPDELQRRRIWQRIWPATLPLDAQVDAQVLARQLKLSGGSIKNIALASAFLAASDGRTVTMDHVRHAAHREYQKLGKTLGAVELGTGAPSQ